MDKLVQQDLPAGEMTDIDSEPVVLVSKVIRGEAIPKFLNEQTPMPHHDGKGPSLLKKTAAAVRTVIDPDRAAYEKLKQDKP